MLDVALLTANASQLKYVLQVGPDVHPFYTLMLTLISISIVLQVILGVAHCFFFVFVYSIRQRKITAF